MNALELPEQLKGPWHHALMMTYGVDIPFFEHAVWSQFGAGCRHKIILADGQQFLVACSNYARSGLVRYLNQRYVAGGIFAQHAAHAKLILLANPEQGRLLVGSGNLNLQGYASGGELFTKYEYSLDAPQSLGAFLMVRELLEGLMAQGMLDPTVRRHINLLLEKSPWLYRSPANTWRPVRHNLYTSFLSQLEQAVGGETVEELWVLSPFYDEAAIALQRLINVFAPRTVKLLVQPGHTSVDPRALRSIRIPDTTNLGIHAVGSENGAYLHAKLYLLKTAEKAICLQGSANLSQVAMLRATAEASAGNVELCNLLEGAPEAFDHLLDELLIAPATDNLESLALSIDSREEDQQDALPPTACHLTGGEWHDNRLILYYTGHVSSGSQLYLSINGQPFALDIESRRSGYLEAILPPEISQLLKRPVPVALGWEGETEEQITNPVFICNRATLEAELAATGGEENLAAVGELDIDDDLEQLVAELESALVIDRHSVWQLVGRSTMGGGSIGSDTEDAEPLSYDQIDYEMLRKHPRMRQYLERSSGSHSQRTRLQIILSAITSHFEGLLDAASVPETATPNLAGDEIEMAETEEEREAEEAERRRRQMSREQRIRRIFKSFIRRYMRGIRSLDFQEFAGFEVMTNNFIIFSHLLWQLSLKEWFEPDLDFLFRAQLKTWRFFWGDIEQDGYLGGLRESDQSTARRWLREQSADARNLAALYRAAEETRGPKSAGLRIELRDFWRSLLTREPLLGTSELLEDLWLSAAEINLFNPPRLPGIIKELVALAHFNTEDRLLRTLTQRHRLPPGSLAFDTVSAIRTVNYQRVKSPVKCLIVRGDNSTVHAQMAIAMLREWAQFESLDYYRISFTSPGEPLKLLYYEVSQAYGVYWDERTGEEIEIGSLETPTTEWASVLNTMRSSAAALEETLSFPVKSVAVATRLSTQ